MGRRLPRPTPETAQVVHQREAFLGALRGRSNVPIPVGRDANSLARSRAGGASASAVRAYQDEFVLTGGEETVELTYLPLTYSEHAYLNGVYQREGDDYDWTRESGTRDFNVLAAMDARADDVLIVEYLYYAGTPAPVPTANECQVAINAVADDPLVYLPLTENPVSDGAVATDDSGNNRNGAYVGFPTAGAASLVGDACGSAVTFSGSVQGVVVPDAGWMDVSTGLTVECWIRYSGSVSGSDFLVARDSNFGGVSASRAWNLQLTATNRPNFVLFNSSTSLALSASAGAGLNDGAAHHIAATYDGSTMRLYIDGSSVGSASLTGGLRSTSAELSIATNSAQTDAFAGTIGHVAMYDAALSPARILAHYNAGT